MSGMQAEYPSLLGLIFFVTLAASMDHLNSVEFTLPASCGMERDVELFLVDAKEREIHGFRKTFHML